MRHNPTAHRALDLAGFRGAALTSCLLVTSLGCGGTGTGGTGDPSVDPTPSAYGDGERVDDLVGDATWLDAGNPDSVDCTAPVREATRVTGLTVVAVDRFDERGDGSRNGNVYTVQTPDEDALQPYSGLTLRTPGATPPDLRLLPGMVIDVSGDFVEFLGPPPPNPFFGFCKTLPQVEGTVSHRFDGEAVEPYPLVPAEAPEGVDRFAVMKSYPSMRPFIGMLVRLENVDVGAVSESSGSLEIPIDVGGGIGGPDQVKVSNELYDIAGTGPGFGEERTHFASITGVVTYFYGFKIAPRSGADFRAD